MLRPSVAWFGSNFQFFVFENGCHPFCKLGDPRSDDRACFDLVLNPNTK